MIDKRTTQLIKSALRKIWFWSLNRREVVKKAKRGHLYECFRCKRRRKKIVVDHVIPVVDPSSGFVDWNSFINRLFCGVANLQVLCKQCHDQKTKTEGGIRRKNALHSPRKT